MIKIRDRNQTNTKRRSNPGLLPKTYEKKKFKTHLMNNYHKLRKKTVW